MGAERTLRLAGGAGGIEDRRVVFGLERNARQRPFRQAGPGVGRTGHRFELANQRMRGLLVFPRDIDPGEIPAIAQMLGQALQPLGVDDRDLGT